MSTIRQTLETFRPAFDRDTHTYRDGRGQIVPSVSELIEPLKAYDGIPEHILEAAARRGEAAHLAVMQYCMTGGSWGLDAAEQLHVDRFARYIEEANFTSDQIIATELPLLHPGMGYAGTIDMLVLDKFTVRVVDLKTGNVDSSCSWIAQVSLYTELVRACLRGIPELTVGNPIIVWTGGQRWAAVEENKVLAISAWTMYRNKNGRSIPWNQIKS